MCELPDILKINSLLEIILYFQIVTWGFIMIYATKNK